MGPNYIALAVPFFFLLLAIELMVAWRRGEQTYRFADAVADIGCGITQRILLLFFEALLLVAYLLVYQHLRLVDVGQRLAAYPVALWALTFIAVDFIFYWWHRASHRSNFLWAAHVVHHQSEQFNLAVALRQSVLTPVTFLPFGLLLAALGVPPLVYAISLALNTLYQFWVHTRLIDRLGPLEWVMMTPSHHRVHHARNERYLDRNYGGVFIVWDRLFGSFADEREQARFGITRPLRSFNALWAQVQPFAELVGLSRGAPGWKGRLAVWLAPPERSFPWAPSAAPPDAPYQVQVSPGVRGYVLANLAVAVAATFALMLWGAALPPWLLVAGAALVLLTVLAAGGLTEARRWARRLELARLAAILATAAVTALTLPART